MENNEKKSTLQDELIGKVAGGDETIEDARRELAKQYLQPDGTYLYVCDKCGAKVTGTEYNAFLTAMAEHINSHIGPIVPWGNVTPLDIDITK